MLKTPQNLTVALLTYRKRLLKEFVNSSWSITKNLMFLWSTENMVCLELQREGGDVTLLHIRLRGQRLPQGQNGTF